jgi:hypothetical protein
MMDFVIKGIGVLSLIAFVATVIEAQGKMPIPNSI